MGHFSYCASLHGPILAVRRIQVQLFVHLRRIAVMLLLVWLSHHMLLMLLVLLLYVLKWLLLMRLTQTHCRNRIVGADVWLA